MYYIFLIKIIKIFVYKLLIDCLFIENFVLFNIYIYLYIDI